MIFFAFSVVTVLVVWAICSLAEASVYAVPMPYVRELEQADVEHPSSARGLLEGNEKSLQLIKTCAEDRPIAVQLFGPDPVVMCDAAQLLQERGVLNRSDITIADEAEGTVQ